MLSSGEAGWGKEAGVSAALRNNIAGSLTSQGTKKPFTPRSGMKGSSSFPMI